MSASGTLHGLADETRKTGKHAIRPRLLCTFETIFGLGIIRKCKEIEIFSQKRSQLIALKCF